MSAAERAPEVNSEAADLNRQRPADESAEPSRVGFVRAGWRAQDTKPRAGAGDRGQFTVLQGSAGNAALRTLFDPQGVSQPVVQPRLVDASAQLLADKRIDAPGRGNGDAYLGMNQQAFMAIQRVAGNAAARTLVSTRNNAPTRGVNGPPTVVAGSGVSTDATQDFAETHRTIDESPRLPGQAGSVGTTPPDQPTGPHSLRSTGRALPLHVVRADGFRTPTPAPANGRVTVQRLGEGLIDGIRGRLNGLVGGVRSGFERVRSVANSAVDTVTDGAMAAGRRLESIGQAIADRARLAWSSLESLASTVTDGLMTRLRQMVGGVRGAASAVRSAIENLEIGSARAAWSRLTAAVGAGEGWLRQAGAAAGQRLGDAWERLRGGIGSAVAAISPQQAMEQALGLAASARARLGSAWDVVVNAGQGIGSLPLPGPIRAVLDSLLSIGRRVWSGAQEAWPAIQSRVGGLADRVRSSVGGVWDRVRSGVTSLGDGLAGQWSSLSGRVRGVVDRVTSRVSSMAGRLRGVSLGTVFDKLTGASQMIRAVRRGLADPEATLTPILDSIVGRLQAGMPAQAHQEAAARLSADAAPPSPSSAVAAPALQRQPSVVVQRQPRSTAYGVIFAGVGDAIDKKWGALSLRTLAKQILMNLIWPWPAVGEELSAMLSDWREAAGTLFVPRTSAVLDFFEDLWTDILHLVDFPLILIRRLIDILTLLMGWITLALVVIGAFLPALAGTVLGGIFSAAASLGIAAPAGAAAGAAAGGAVGALAGLAAAAVIGEGLLAAFILVQATVVAKSFVDLLTARQTQEEKGRDFNQVADSIIGIGVAVVLFALSFIGGRMAGGAIKALRGTRVPPPPELPAGGPRPVEGGGTRPVEGGGGEPKPTDTGEPKPTEPSTTPSRGAPPKTGETVAQFGERLAEESRGQPSRFDYIVAEINKAGLTQDGAADAAASATKGIGLRLVRLTEGPNTVLSSVKPGPNGPILIIKPNGSIVRGSATIAIASPPSLERPIVLSDITEGK